MCRPVTSSTVCGEQLRPADREGGVDLVGAVAGDRDVGVARDRDEDRLAATLGDVDEHDRVGAVALRPAGLRGLGAAGRSAPPGCQSRRAGSCGPTCPPGAHRPGRCRPGRRCSTRPPGTQIRKATTRRRAARRAAGRAGPLRTASSVRWAVAGRAGGRPGRDPALGALAGPDAGARPRARSRVSTV